MRLPVLAMMGLLGAGCTSARDDPAPAGESATARASAAPALASPVPDATGQPSPQGVADVRAACAAAAEPWRRLRGVTLREVDTLITSVDIIDDPETDTIPPPGSVGGRWPACMVVGLASEGMDEATRSTLYWPAHGWGVLRRLNADGPGSQVQVHQRDRVRCQVTEEGDPGDDGDSAYVPDPFFRQITLCWHHARPLDPRDTMLLEP